MVQRRYTGLYAVESHFLELRPLRAKLIWMAGQWAPTSWEYAELHKPVLALDACAEAITRRPRFFATPPHTTSGGPTGLPPMLED